MEPLQIVVATQGFVFVGNTRIADGWLHLTNARNVRRWGTTEGLIQLANHGPTPETRLDGKNGFIRVPLTSVVFTLDCMETAWNR